jgi:hypothetical protein
VDDEHGRVQRLGGNFRLVFYRPDGERHADDFQSLRNDDKAAFVYVPELSDALIDRRNLAGGFDWHAAKTIRISPLRQ